jgi:TolA-binding protein
LRPGDRPGIGDRPGVGPGDRPTLRPGDRPGIGADDRPTLRPGDRPIDRPNIGPDARPDIRPDTRPGIADRPWYQDRPTRPGYETRPGNIIGSGNEINIGNIQNNIYNRPTVSNRPWYGQPWNAPTYHYHYGWHHGYWNYWPPGAYYPWAYGAGVATGWLLGGANVVYANPYYVVPATTTTAVYDYSQPIPVSTPAQPTTVNVNVTGGTATADSTSTTPTPPPEDPKTQAAIDKFDSARAAFKQGDFDSALKQVDEAIKELPGDPVLHEFRGLVLFAQGKYQPAAATIYAVLAAGPGWDWETLKALYPNTQTYTDQLYKLEDYVKAHQDAADARFLLSYHYLTLGYTDEAREQLEIVVQQQPGDQLSAQLVKLLTPGETGDAAPANS